MTGAPRTLFIVCGEPSGEAYAAGVARVFRRRFPRSPMEGIGGPRLSGEGVTLLADYNAISVVGLTEVVRHLPGIAATMRKAVRRATRPDVGALLLVDFPDFNFRVGHRVRAAGIPVVYYIPPQLWAWRPGRARELARFTKGVVVAFPFEEAILKGAGVNAVFAGHPILDELSAVLDAPPDPARFGLPPGGDVVGLLPGSRPGEVRSHLPVMLEAARRILRDRPGTRFVLPLAAPHLRAVVDPLLEGAAAAPLLCESDRHLMFRGMTAAVTASGTATLELALLGVPAVIVYRTSAVTYGIGKFLARVRSIGLPNILAGEPFLPELVQDAFTPERVASEILRYLEDEDYRRRTARACAGLREALRGTGPAEAVVDMLATEAAGAWA